jgi:hypothetical protein
MVILGKLDLNVKDINIKKSLKYSNDFTFVGLSLNKKDICIQTPKLYTKYGINKNYDKSFINLSLQNIENDNTIKNFKFNLDLIYNFIKRKYYNYNVVNYLKDLEFRLKVKDNIKIYDKQKNAIINIMSNTYGNYIIYLQGFWIINKDIYFQWYVLQAKIDLPLHLNDYAFIDESPKNIPKNIPKPPPLPIFKRSENKIVIKKNKVKIEKKGEVPSLDDIRFALSRLKCINDK